MSWFSGSRHTIVFKRGNEMHVIHVKNVHEALPEGVHHLQKYGLREETRVGEVLVAQTPVMTVYDSPLERVLFWKQRDANPVFHLMEGLWMLAGRNDVEWIVRFNSNMKQFSDDGVKFHGAYGHRWREYFMCELGVDQLEYVIRLLTNNPKTRRAVIQMWDAPVDLHVDEKTAPLDIPCNTHIYLQVRTDLYVNVLDMTVCCRSNDMIWGAYGANAVHFSILQEYLAAKLGLFVGKFYQFSNNYHAYVDVLEKVSTLAGEIRDPHRMIDRNPYFESGAWPVPMVDNPATFMSELDEFMDNEYPFDTEDLFDYENKFLIYADILRRAYLEYKETKDAGLAIRSMQYLFEKVELKRWDFQLATAAWMWRRVETDETS